MVYFFKPSNNSLCGTFTKLSVWFFFQIKYLTKDACHLGIFNKTFNLWLRFFIKKISSIEINMYGNLTNEIISGWGG